VSAAYKLAKATPSEQATRDRAIQASLVRAAQVPLETARACADAAELAATCAELGNTNAASDAGVAALLAEAACRGAAYNVRINVSAMSGRSQGEPLAAEANALVARAGEATRRATHRVEQQIG
jgi:glutamate formiminotransferase/formiminotetrahydrofolate cyclodeaminase